MAWRALVGAGALWLVAGGISWAQEAQPKDDRKEEKKDEKRKEESTLSAARLAKGPSLQETGRVGSMSVQTSGFQAPRAPNPHAPVDSSVRLAASSEDRPTPAAEQGVIDPAVLEREIRARFNEVRSCRIDVARRKQIAPALVTAKSLALRWTILPSGTVTATQIVALSPTDPDLIACLKQRMSQWSFTRPVGGALSVDRMFSLR